MGRTGALLRKKHEAPHPRDVALNSNRDATKPNWRGGDGLFLDRSVCFRIVINKLGTYWGSEIPPYNPNPDYYNNGTILTQPSTTVWGDVF